MKPVKYNEFKLLEHAVNSRTVEHWTGIRFPIRHVGDGQYKFSNQPVDKSFSLNRHSISFIVTRCGDPLKRRKLNKMLRERRYDDLAYAVNFVAQSGGWFEVSPTDDEYLYDDAELIAALVDGGLYGVLRTYNPYTNAEVVAAIKEAEFNYAVRWSTLTPTQMNIYFRSAFDVEKFDPINEKAKRSEPAWGLTLINGETGEVALRWGFFISCGGLEIVRHVAHDRARHVSGERLIAAIAGFKNTFSSSTGREMRECLDVVPFEVGIGFLMNCSSERLPVEKIGSVIERIRSLRNEFDTSCLSLASILGELSNVRGFKIVSGILFAHMHDICWKRKYGELS